MGRYLSDYDRHKLIRSSLTFRIRLEVSIWHVTLTRHVRHGGFVLWRIERSAATKCEA